MRAAAYERPGPASQVLEVRDFPTPRPGPGEVLVKVHASGVNPTDIKSRTNFFERIRHLVPVIPHHDAGGVIEAVGEGVKPNRVGERVWTYIAHYERAHGTCADYVVLPESRIATLPEATSFEEGACLGVPAMTAYHAVTLNGPVEGKTVMVTGGAGAVGHYAIQIARHLGAGRIIATVSSDEKAAHAGDAGADTIINYRSEDVPGRVMEATGGKGADHYIEVDLHGNGRMLGKVCAFGGFIALYGSNKPEAALIAPEFFIQHLRMHGFVLYRVDDDRLKELADAINAMLEQGKLKHRIAARYSLDDIAKAHDDVEFGKVIGNVLVMPG